MTVNILDYIRDNLMLLDGGMGTELIKRGFSVGECPESWNLSQKEAIQAIHYNYFQAGADAVSTNSFGGSSIKLAAYQMEDRCYEINRIAAELACSIRPEGRYVAGSMGPTGKFLQPQGEFTPGQFEDAFREQARGLIDGGVDFLLIETMYDLNEAIAAVRAAKTCCDIPVFTTMTFNRTPRGFFTIMGNKFEQLVEAAEDLGISAVGANCTLDSGDMAELVKHMRESTELPIIAQANAGQPQVNMEGVIRYDQSCEAYVSHIPSMLGYGVNIIGGCCGTDPQYIQRMAALMGKH